MSVQEAALYGDLVLALRDHAAQQLASVHPGLDVADATNQLDEFIRTWFFTPQEGLYGSAPREVIWREQLGQENPLPREYAREAYCGDDCPLCQMLIEELENAPDDESHGHFWGYAPDHSLLDLYDLEGSAARWREEDARFAEWRTQQAGHEDDAPDFPF